MKFLSLIQLFFCGAVAFVRSPSLHVHFRSDSSNKVRKGMVTRSLSGTPNKPLDTMPKAIIFDLDGCLWSPEMYEIIFFQGGRGSPFVRDPDNPLNLLTCGNEPVQLLADVRSVFKEIYTNPVFECVKFGISSRTDEPNWAKELLEKFIIPIDDQGTDGEEYVNLGSIFNGPIEICKDSKIDHFRRIAKDLEIDFSEILFFDNEYRNCESVASLGVSVVHCPEGVTKELWNLGVYKDFPRSDGTVIDLDVR